MFLLTHCFKHKLLLCGLLLGMIGIGELGVSKPVRSQPEGFVLAIAAEATVPGPKITLADLGVASGATDADMQFLRSVKLGLAPVPGETRVFTRDYLKLLLKQQPYKHLPQLIMGDQVVIQVVTCRFTAEALSDAMMALLPPKPLEIVKQWITFRNLPPEVCLPAGDWKLHVEVVGDLPNLGKVLFKLEFTDRSVHRELMIDGVIHKSAVIYRAVSDLALHSQVSLSFYHAETGELTGGDEWLGQFPQDYRSIKVLKKGTVLSKGDIQPVPAVMKGMEVKVLVKGDGVEIGLTGIAKADGWPGDEICLLNPVTKKEFSGKVTAKGTVEVLL